MTKAPIKVFIASSGLMKGIADALCRELEDTARRYKLEIKGQVWHRDVAILGEDILSSLIDHCRGNGEISRSDYFVAILTPDDQRRKKGRWTETPRDNCIFELGLFIGGLGFDHRRCFMLCAVKELALPSDLGGRTYLSFTPPNAKTSTPHAEQDAIKDPAAKIVGQMLSMKRFNPPGVEAISKDDLMALERPQPEGDLEDGAEVLVNRSQPVEEQYKEFAAIVATNMLQGINYRYFFHDLKSMRLIARLVYNISISSSESAPKSGARLSDQQIRERLKLISKQMSIHIVPSNGPIDFCVHNAETPKAVCYLRVPDKDQFIEWCRYAPALNIAREQMELSGAEQSSTCVFSTTQLFDINAPKSEQYKNEFWTEINRLFASKALEDDIRRACFGDVAP